MQPTARQQPTKFIFVTGGVVSSLGKGIAAASLGRLLVERGLRVTMMKFDPYINVDPGTMSPFQHGEVYVTDDGAETDQRPSARLALRQKQYRLVHRQPAGTESHPSTLSVALCRVNVGEVLHARVQAFLRAQFP